MGWELWLSLTLSRCAQFFAVDDLRYQLGTEGPGVGGPGCPLTEGGGAPGPDPPACLPLS